MNISTPATEFVADTVAMILRLEGRKMGATAETIFDNLEKGNAIVYVSGMSLAEILYLSEKKLITNDSVIQSSAFVKTVW